MRTYPLIFFLLLLATGYTCSQTWGNAADPGGQASGSSPASDNPQSAPGNVVRPVALRPVPRPLAGWEEGYEPAYQGRLNGTAISVKSRLIED